jgi:hypothetical protein
MQTWSAALGGHFRDGQTRKSHGELCPVRQGFQIIRASESLVIHIDQSDQKSQLFLKASNSQFGKTLEMKIWFSESSAALWSTKCQGHSAITQVLLAFLFPQFDAPSRSAHRGSLLAFEATNWICPRAISPWQQTSTMIRPLSTDCEIVKCSQEPGQKHNIEGRILLENAPVPSSSWIGCPEIVSLSGHSISMFPILFDRLESPSRDKRTVSFSSVLLTYSILLFPEGISEDSEMKARRLKGF